MKKILILTIGCSLEPWQPMMQTSLDTWDSVEVDDIENIFYFGGPVKENTDKTIYFDLEESYYTMSRKTLSAFEWALENKQFDYIIRINSSTYVDNKLLSEYINQFEDTNVFAGIEVDMEPKWMVGWCYIISKDVVQKFVDNKHLFSHTITDDLAISYVANEIEIPYTKLKICSINKTDTAWSLIGYNGPSFEFTDFNECVKAEMPFYRCKNDLDRTVDKHIMQELYRTLNA